MFGSQIDLKIILYYMYLILIQWWFQHQNLRGKRGHERSSKSHVLTTLDSKCFLFFLAALIVSRGALNRKGNTGMSGSQDHLFMPF